MQNVLKHLRGIGLQRVIWATDLDSTIIDAGRDPAQVKAPPELTKACQTLDKQTGGFYIITGRDIEAIDRIFSGTPFKASAEYHNMARFDLSQPPVDISQRPKWDLIDQDLDDLGKQWPGLIMRKKPFMRTIYYHMEPAFKDPAIKAQAMQQLETLMDKVKQATGQALVNTDGGRVFDLVPAGQDKGSAYKDVLGHAGKNYKGKEPLVPLYFGDSPGDLPAAHFVKNNGGIFVAVGSDASVTTIADFTLKDPAECRALFVAASNPQPHLAPRPKGPKGP